LQFFLCVSGHGTYVFGQAFVKIITGGFLSHFS